MSPKEFFGLVHLGLTNKFYNARLNWSDRRRFGKQRWFWRLRLARGLSYLGVNPFKLSRRQGRRVEIAEQNLIYGETPIGTAYDILEELGANEEDTLVDLGSGRGTWNFVAALAFGCRGIGLEALPGFVSRSRAMAKSLSLDLEFEETNILDGELPAGTIYCVAPTTFDEQAWESLQQLMHQAEVGSKAIVLTKPLPKIAWKTLEESPRAYSWGESVTYIQERI